MTVRPLYEYRLSVYQHPASFHLDLTETDIELHGFQHLVSCLGSRGESIQIRCLCCPFPWILDFEEDGMVSFSGSAAFIYYEAIGIPQAQYDITVPLYVILYAQSPVPVFAVQIRSDPEIVLDGGHIDFQVDHREGWGSRG